MAPTQQVSKRAILYARTSADSENEGLKLSIEEQLEACRNLAQSHGYNIIGEYYDRNRSGRTYPTGSPFVNLDPVFEQYFREHIKIDKCRTRDGLGEIFKRLDNIDIIIVRDETRLMRPLLNSFLESWVCQTLAAHNVIVHSISEGIISPSNHEQQMISRLKANTKDKDVLTRIKDSKASLDRLRNNGDLYHGVTMFGFRSLAHQKIAPIEDELKIVRRIYNLYLAGSGIMTICKLFNAENVKTKTGQGHWSDGQVRSILTRILYTGWQTTSFGGAVESKHFKPHAVISLDEFHRVEAKLGKQKKYPRQAGVIHPCSGLVFCGACGHHARTFQTPSSLCRNKITRLDYYICMSGLYRDPGQKNLCRLVTIREKVPVENGINQNGNGLIEFLSPLLYTGLIRHLIQQKYKAGMRDDVLNMEREVERINEVEKKLLTMNIAGKISDVQFDNLMVEYKGKRNILGARLSEIKEHIQNVQRISIPAESFQNLKDVQMTPELMRDLCHKAFERIDIFPDKVRISMAGGGQFDIERMRIRNSRALPFWIVNVDSQAICLETKIEISYLYKSAINPRSEQDMTPVTVVYEDQNLKVVTVGRNDIGTYNLFQAGERLTGNRITFGAGVKNEESVATVEMANLSSNSKIDLLPLSR